MKRVPLVWHTLRWPRDVNADDLDAVMRLLVTAAGSPIVLETTGQAGSVTHQIAVTEGRHENIAHQLRQRDTRYPGRSRDVEASIGDRSGHRGPDVHQAPPAAHRPDVGRESLDPRGTR